MAGLGYDTNGMSDNVCLSRQDACELFWYIIALLLCSDLLGVLLFVFAHNLHLILAMLRWQAWGRTRMGQGLLAAQSACKPFWHIEAVAVSFCKADCACMDGGNANGVVQMRRMPVRVEDIIVRSKRMMVWCLWQGAMWSVSTSNAGRHSGFGLLLDEARWFTLLLHIQQNRLGEFRSDLHVPSGLHALFHEQRPVKEAVAFLCVNDRGG